MFNKINTVYFSHRLNREQYFVLCFSGFHPLMIIVSPSASGYYAVNVRMKTQLFPGMQYRADTRRGIHVFGITRKCIERVWCGLEHQIEHHFPVVHNDSVQLVPQSETSHDNLEGQQLTLALQYGFCFLEFSQCGQRTFEKRPAA